MEELSEEGGVFFSTRINNLMLNPKVVCYMYSWCAVGKNSS